MTRSAAQVRQEFIDFFVRKHGHAFVPSSPVVPHDDPTLLFANAGMNQFKPYFLGTETPSDTRVANTQKCIRAGGKHNDLDDVGHDTYHHTFFEMLGNWSFGDYFKQEAIAWAWELLVDVWGLEPDRLHATYFEGDAAEGLAPDIEARDLWLKILPAERVHPGNKQDNFWEMGDTGPCGPCSEIHIDLTPDLSGGPLVNAGDARVIEIWNLVFIQFNRAPGGALSPLPAKHVDTGMGFERVTAVLQGHNNNYATDVFVPIVQAIERMTGHVYGADEPTADPNRAREEAVPAHPNREREEAATSDPNRARQEAAAPRYAAMRPGNMRDEACRVIADHVRCLAFALTDGAVPDREGRGYVLRRILRRGVRFGWQYLDLHKPFLCELVDTVVRVMGDAFPELQKNADHVKAVIREEEESFERTLDRGIALFEEAANTAQRHHHREIRGEDAFKLHDTYGFPIDLTEVMAAEKGLRVDIGEYERLMEEARQRARAGGKGGDGGAGHIKPEEVRPHGPTDDNPKYANNQIEAFVRAMVRFLDDGSARVLSNGGALAAGDRAAVITDKTCFYAEQGGQIGDRGDIESDLGRFEVEDTIRLGDVVLHLGTQLTGSTKPGDVVRLKVDPHREATKKNHTATHVLNWALRAVLGDHVQQKGSLVDAEKTRFDFSHPKAVTFDELRRVEELVNERIAQHLPVHDKPVPQEDALRIHGLRAVFGEKYPDMVRVLSIGTPVDELLADPENPAWRDTSIEFCGGTHVNNTGDIERFLFTVEEAVAKGIRRVVGVTGTTAQLVEDTGHALIQHAESLKQAPPEEVRAGLAELQRSLADAQLAIRHRVRLNELLADLQQIVRQQQQAVAADAAGVVHAKVDELLAAAEKMGETTVVVAEMPDVPLDQLKNGADRIKQSRGSAAVLFGVRSGEKAVLLAAMSDDLVKRGVKAGDLVKQAAKLVKGGGGGPPTMAQAGGKDPGKLDEALDAGRAWIMEKLG